MVSALALAPLSLVVAINQSTPLIATACAAALLGESVGPRRWFAIGVGFCGVMLILGPQDVAVTAGVLFSVGAAFGMAARDVFTRLVPDEATTLQVSLWGPRCACPGRRGAHGGHRKRCPAGRARRRLASRRDRIAYRGVLHHHIGGSACGHLSCHTIPIFPYTVRAGNRCRRVW